MRRATEIDVKMMDIAAFARRRNGVTASRRHGVTA
ncbi:cytosine permease [Burkholderia mayonis]|uniref:Cytosine permease n=1 Tax=Burkholderia mayonis TaxID=1385591 RepID=A0A1B4FT65_9BURK|nr:cytosine permease [Burkholderia mayonis]KVE57611.1 cytosine permease [Burkholderia mayonis]